MTASRSTLDTRVRVGLRVDVDTYRGTRLGVPTLVDLLERHEIRASFFFAVGPDNMGRHLWRLRKPRFLWKMLRTKPVTLYGWDIVLRGTLWPGPQIARRLGPCIRAAADAGHEIGLHAWDHHAWQEHLDEWDGAEIRDHLERGFVALTEAAGRAPTCSAAPAWRCNERVLIEKERFEFAFNSDCRGNQAFTPVAAGRRLHQPQIPVSLPTYDEAVGRDGVTDVSYNGWLLNQLRPGQLNVLTVHAEVEGIVHAEMFDAFLREAKRRRVEVVPLCELLDPSVALPLGGIRAAEITGREGHVACQIRVPAPETTS